MSSSAARRGLAFSWLTICLVGCGGGSDGGGGGSGGKVVDAASGGADASGGAGGADSGEGGGVAPDGGIPDACADDTPCPQGYFCAIGADALDGRCQPGCRKDPDTCGAGFVCADDAMGGRVCNRDLHCEDDDGCDPGLYCDHGMCAMGCRVAGEDSADSCPTGDNPYRECDAHTHQCVDQVPCCNPDMTCTFAAPSACADPAPGAGCFNPNPCEGRCARDPDCGAGQYCAIPDGAAQGHCADGCRSGGAAGCPPGRRCNTDSHTCERYPCPNGDGDCPANQFCADDAQCEIGCRTEPDNCPEDQLCQANRACSGSCQGDADCVRLNGDGFYCDGGECRAPCISHDSCHPGEACDPQTHRCAMGCRDDAFEPNGDADHATALPLDAQNAYDSGDMPLHVCGNDADWYRFDTPSPGWHVRVTVTFHNASGDLDALLYDPSGNVVARGESADDDEVLDFPPVDGVVSPGGTYRVQVYPRGLSENDYTLRVELTPAGACLPDDVDDMPRRDDEAVDATAIDLPQLQQTQVIQNRTVCLDDEDWYTFRMGAGDGLDLRLSIHGNGAMGGDDLTFEVFGPGLPDANSMAAFLPNAVGMGDDGSRVVELLAPRNNPQVLDGRYYVRVHGANGQQTSQYDLAVTVDRIRALCMDDRAEPNDTRPQAFDLFTVPAFVRQKIGGGGVELIPGRDLLLDDLWLCSGEEDWYRVQVDDGDDLAAAVLRQDAVPEGDTLIEIRDSQGRAVGQSGRSSQNVNEARAAALPAGNYYVWVSGVADTQSQYTLRVNRTTAPAMCPPDAFDRQSPNDAQQAATAIMPGTYQNLLLCGGDGDEDWYTFTTDDVAQISVTVRFAAAQGNLDVEVWREGRGVPEDAGQAGHGNGDDEVVVLPQRPAGRYFVRVYGIGQPEVRYDLELDVQAVNRVCAPPADDTTGFDDAAVLGAGPTERAGEYLCDQVPRDEDYFQIEVPANATRTIAATFLYGDDGDLYLSAFDNDRMLSATTQDLSRGISKQCIVIDPADGDRFFYVRVVPLSINDVLENDQSLAYQLFVRDGDVCDDLPPDVGPVPWPHVQ